MAEKYLVQVTAGSSYDHTKHQIVPVNDSKPITIESEHITANLNVRIQSYRGLPFSSPQTSPYFSQPQHARNDDQYSIAFSFTPKSTINGNDLVFGNDFDYPIRDRLPPGFGTAFRIVKWMIDPGLDGDVYANRPYLYGPATSSLNTIFVGNKASNQLIQEMADEKAGLIICEGGSDDGIALRRAKGIPDSEAARKKFFLNEGNRKAWDWEAGREYGCDFFNPYLDFNAFALRLPGFALSMVKYWDGQGLRSSRDKWGRKDQFKMPKRSHSLRYTLKNRATNTILFVVVFTLYLKEDVDDRGIVKESVRNNPLLGLNEVEKIEVKHEKNGTEERKNLNNTIPIVGSDVD